VPDKELVATAGIDALAFIRVCQFGIQLFVPISVLAIFVLIPVHVSGRDLDRQKEEFISRGGDAEDLRSGLNSRMMRTTAANLVGLYKLTHRWIAVRLPTAANKCSSLRSGVGFSTPFTPGFNP
jgi:hypothetical protein